MKTSNSKILITACFIAASVLFSFHGFSQTRKSPDGTIIYSDGTKRLPNGTVIYKDGGTMEERERTVRLPDGTIIYPDGTRKHGRERKHQQRREGRWMPPGQAKKVYGGSAKDYAPGQQKKWKKNKGRK